MSIKKKWIGLNQVDGERILLDNNETLRAKDSAGSAVDLMKLDGDDKLRFLLLPKVTVDPTDGNDVVRKSFVESEITAAETALQNQIDAHEGRIANAEGDIETLQNDLLAEYAARAGADNTETAARVAADSLEASIREAADALEASTREAADNALDARLDVVEGDVGTLKTDMSAETAARESADTALDMRLDVLEGDDQTPGSVAKAKADAEAYTDSKVSQLINGAPAILDTLKELSDALGADANFSVTVGNQISGLDSRLDTLEGDASVSGSVAHSVAAEAAARVAGDNALDARVTTAEGDIDTLQSDMTAEIANRIAGDNAEAAARVAGDNTEAAARIAGDDAEAAARIAADSALNVRLTASEGSISSLQSYYNSVDGYSQDIRDDLDAEIANRIAGDNAEAALRSAADTSLGNRLTTAESDIDTLQSDMTAETSARVAADNLEASTRSAADTALSGRLDTAESDIDALQLAMTAETSARESADNALDSRLDTAESDIDTLQSDLTAEVSARQAAVSSEATARAAADNDLDSRLDILEGDDQTPGSVAKAKADAESYTDSKISQLVNGAPAILDTLKELSDALGSDANFATTISNQISDLDGRLDTLEGDATVSGSVAHAVAAEASARDAADVALDGRLDTAESDIDALQLAMSAETTARESADTALDGRLDTVESDVSTLQSDMLAEVSARESADTALDSRIDALEADAVTKTYVDTQVSSEAAARETQDNAINARIDALPIERMSYESHVINSTDLTNQYVEVQYDIVSQPMIQVNRVWLAPSDDFSIDGSIKKRILISTIQATSEALEVGDKLHIWYARAN